MNLYVFSMYPLPLGQPQGPSSKQIKETCLLGLAMHLGQPHSLGTGWIQGNCTFAGAIYTGSQQIFLLKIFWKVCQGFYQYQKLDFSYCLGWVGFFSRLIFLMRL